MSLSGVVDFKAIAKSGSVSCCFFGANDSAKIPLAVRKQSGYTSKDFSSHEAPALNCAQVSA
jgi:hypothetical protein